MLSLLVLFVLILIVSQIDYASKTDARVSRNENALVAMDMAIESVLLQVYEDLKADAEADASAGDGGGGAPAGGDASAAFGGDGGGGGEGQAAADSREDEWARPQRAELNELRLRIFVQDEDSKFNVLSILAEDEEQAEKAFERLVRVIENARKGTEREIDGGDARRMATALLEFMNRRQDQYLPKPDLLSDDEDNDDIGLPFSLRELVALDPELFHEDLFRDVRDERDQIVHSLTSFLTVYTSLTTAGEAAGSRSGGGTGDDSDSPADDTDGDGREEGDGGGDNDGGNGGGGNGGEQDGGSGDDAPDGDSGQSPFAGGGATSAEADGRINVNTAPPAVLKALVDDRDVPFRFWDDAIEYRNEEDEEVEENDEPPLDEFGREILVHKYFGSFDDLTEIDGWESIEPAFQDELRGMLKTQSSVFSIYVTARQPAGDDDVDPNLRPEEIERQEAEGKGLVRTVRSVVWRHSLGDGEIEIVPIVRWEVVDYVPYAIRDFPGEERR